MSTNDNAKELFARLYDLPAEKRDALLDDACGDDVGLRLEVQRLLVQAGKADQFFGDTDGVTLAAEEFEGSCEVAGDRVGPYLLRQKIGEGGFGVVWMAEQSEPISRMVAVKVVKAGMDTKQVLARFEAERQALAMMDHSNIARVLDAGATASGRPYFAMELVKGIPITRFCDDQKLDARRRLELFKDVCSAVNHAHQKGIIHRDLKPSNVMVTLAADVPVVKVIDFGIAKATHSKLTEKTLFTRFEQFLGTPVYMSPEQAALSAIDVDTRSDIYSLGVLLYELLAGSPPFDQKSLLSAGYDEMRRIIREEEPPKPSTKLTETQARSTAAGTRQKLHVSVGVLKGELDWIVMKAIEKDRTRRYETANAFAADIGRYLADEPVQAAAPSAAYKFRKFTRRNKAAIGVAAAMLVLLLAGIAATAWQAVRATAEADRANEAEALATERLGESEEAREEAESISQFLVGMFESSRPGEENGGREVKVADILDRAVEKLESALAGQPVQRAKLQLTIGGTYRALGLDEDAIRVLEKAHECFQQQLGAEHPDTFRAMNSLAMSCQNLGRLDRAIPLLEELLKLYLTLHGPEHLDTLTTMDNLAGCYYDAGRREKALEMREEALELQRKVSGPEHSSTLSTMNNLATSYYGAGRRDEALAVHEELLALRQKVNGPQHPLTLVAMNNLAISYNNAGHSDKALAMQEQVLELRQTVLGPEHPETILAMENLAVSYNMTGRRAEALAMREKVFEQRSELLGPEHPDTLLAMANLAKSYFDAGRADEALAMCEKVLEVRKKVLGPEHADTLTAMENLAVAYHNTGRQDEALKLQEEMLDKRTKVLGPEHPETLWATTSLAVYYQANARLDEALALFEKALAGLRKINHPKHPDILYTLDALSRGYLAAGREAEARALREELASLKANQQTESEPSPSKNP